MTPPLVVVERHRNRKSVPDCDAFQKKGGALQKSHMFRFAWHEHGTAVPVRCIGVPLGKQPRPRHGGRPTKREATPRYFRFADSRFSVAKTSKMFAAFSVNVVRALGRQCHACAQKKPPTKVGGAVLTSKLTVDLACRPGLDRPAGHLARASAPADPASAGRRRPAGRPGHPDRLDRRPGFAGHLDSAGQASVRWRSYICSFSSLRDVTTRALRLSSCL